MEEDKLLDLLVSVKNMVRSDPQTARQTLTSHPNLAYALMKEMVVLDVVDPEVLTRTLQAATGVQPTPAPAPAPVPAPPQNYGAYPQQVTPSYPPPSSTPSYPPPSPTSSYPPPSSIPSYPPPSSAPPYPPASQPQPQPQAPSIPPHMYQQSRPQQQPATPPVQSRGPPPPQPQPAAPAPMGLAPEQQAMIQRLAMLTPDQIAALPPADRAALLELRRQLGLS